MFVGPTISVSGFVVVVVVTKLQYNNKVKVIINKVKVINKSTATRMLRLQTTQCFKLWQITLNLWCDHNCRINNNVLAVQWVVVKI